MNCRFLHNIILFLYIFNIDCIICNPNHPHTIDHSGKHSIIFADGVDSVIEVKPDLQNKKELERGLEQIRSVKKLRRHQTPLFLPQTQERINHSLQIPCFIFCLKAKSNIDDTMQEIYQYYKLKSVPLEEQFDYIVINGKGILCNYKLPELNRRYIGTALPKYGYWFEEMNDLTFAGFLLYLDIVDPAIPRSAEGILERYLGSTTQLTGGTRRYNIEDFWK